MSKKDTHGGRCSIIDEFVDQGAPLSGKIPRTSTTGSVGCTIITEVIGQGQATTQEMQVAIPTGSLNSSASEGCEAIMTFTDEGFIPSVEKKNSADVA